MQSNEISQMVLAYKDKLYRVAMRIVGDTMEAEDVVQEVLIKIWKKKEQFLGIENKEAWCMAMTRNLAIDKIRARKKKIDSIDNYYHISDRSSNPHEITQTEDSMNMIRKMMDNLPEKQKTVLHLRDIEGYSYKEIHQITGLSLDQVKINLHRARKSLREKLINWR